MDLETLLLVLAVGVGVGFLGGLFGKGGSAIATPILAALGIPPLIALASPLPATLPATIAAWSRYRQVGHVDNRVVRFTLLAGLPATAAGAYATRWIGGDALVLATEVVILGLGLKFALHPQDATEVVRTGVDHTVRAVAIGAGVGLLSGLLANAGGFLLAPLFILVLRLPTKSAFGSSLAVAACLAVPGTVVHAALGHIDWVLAAVFAAGSVPAASWGARCALRTEAVALQRIYGVSIAALAALLLAVSR
jgi:uncharacterized membrane protein YfcA